MKIDMKNTYEYKYIEYRLGYKCKKDENLKNLSEDKKKEIRIDAYKKTRKISFIVISVYVPIVIYLLFGMNLSFRYGDIAFFGWYRSTVESAYHLIIDDPGGNIDEKTGTILVFFIRLLPVIIVQSLPLFLPIIIAAEVNLKREIKKRLPPN